MKSLQLVVNGQGLSLEDNGGVWKYSHELYQRVKSSQLQEYLPGADVSGWRFLTPEETNASEKLSRTALPKGLKTLARNWIPPRVFSLARSTFSADKADVPKVDSSFGSNGNVILHEVTNYSSCPEIARLRLDRKLKLCVTFHDLQDLFYPEYFTNKELLRRKFHYLFYKDAADLFFAISEFTKQTMIEKLDIPAGKIKVTYLAGGSPPTAPDNMADKQAKQFGRYLIYPAKLWKHKNHEFLLKAFSIRRDEFKKQGIQLILTGGFSPEEGNALRKTLRHNDIESQVQSLGFQTAGSLSALIRNAEFLVFPSLFEGFGMPVLEALESGCPVFCSNRGSLPEVAGDAVVYFDPEDLDSLVAVFDRLLSGALDREPLIRCGKEQAKKFNWDRTFRETAEGYRELI